MTPEQKLVFRNILYENLEADSVYILSPCDTSICGVVALWLADMGITPYQAERVYLGRRLDRLLACAASKAGFMLTIDSLKEAFDNDFQNFSILIACNTPISARPRP